MKKYAFAPERLVTDDLRSYSAGVLPRNVEKGGAALLALSL